MTTLKEIETFIRTSNLENLENELNVLQDIIDESIHKLERAQIYSEIKSECPILNNADLYALTTMAENISNRLESDDISSWEVSNRIGHALVRGLKTPLRDSAEIIKKRVECFLNDDYETFNDACNAIVSDRVDWFFNKWIPMIEEQKKKSTTLKEFENFIKESDLKDLQYVSCDTIKKLDKAKTYLDIEYNCPTLDEKEIYSLVDLAERIYYNSFIFASIQEVGICIESALTPRADESDNDKQIKKRLNCLLNSEFSKIYEAITEDTFELFYYEWTSIMERQEEE